MANAGGQRECTCSAVQQEWFGPLVAILGWSHGCYQEVEPGGADAMDAGHTYSGRCTVLILSC